MTMPRRPRAITFDFWMTLFQDVHGSERQELRIEAFMAAAGTPELETRKAFEVWPRAFYASHVQEQRTLLPRDAVDITCRELSVTLDDHVADALANRFATVILEYPPEPIEGAIEAVTKAAERVPIGIISDTGISTGGPLRAILEKHGMARYFGALTFSDEVGVSKPQRPMFERTAAALGVAMPDILHIGDLEPTDIAGIRAVGGLGALFTGVNDKYRDATQAEYSFGDWSTFIELLPDLV
jgi:FMN phosphatase YigB (HAD superfamily)